MPEDRLSILHIKRDATTVSIKSQSVDQPWDAVGLLHNDKATTKKLWR